MKNRKLFLALAVVSAFAASSVNAAIIKTSDAPYAFSYGSTQDGYNLLTTGTLDILSLTKNTASLSFVLNNRSTSNGSTPAAPTDVRLTDFGFGFTGSTITGATFVDAADGGLIKSAVVSAFPGVDGIQVCAFAGTSCGSQTFGGIYDLASDTFKINLMGIFNPTSGLNLTSLGSKFDTSTKYVNGWHDDTPTNVPEPGSMALLGLGLAGIAFASKKKFNA